MVKVTADVYKIVWIKIKGESRGFPKLPDDDGLCIRFRKWLSESDIIPAIIAGSSGPGFDNSGFWPVDAEKVLAWLEENNVEMTEIIPADR